MARCFNLMADWSGSGRYRGVIPSVALAQLGHEVMCSTNPGAKHKDGSTFAAGASVWIGHRIDAPEPTALFAALARSARTAMLVIDLDDNVWNVHESNNAYGLGFPHRVSANMAVADMVTVCSHGLAEIASSHSKIKQIVVVPNYVPDEMLSIERDEPDELPKLIFGGSASHVIDIPILQRVLPRLGEGFKVRMLGHQFNLGIDPGRIEYALWSDNLNVYYRYIDGDIGLAPLVNDIFNLGKSDLKVIEYMARGIPFVASRVGPYAEIAHLHGKAGFFVDNNDEWGCAIRHLMDDPSMRAEMGAAGKAWVRDIRVASVGARVRERIFRIEHQRGAGVYAEAP